MANSPGEALPCSCYHKKQETSEVAPAMGRPLGRRKREANPRGMARVNFPRSNGNPDIL